jgi:hypothetical protein
MKISLWAARGRRTPGWCAIAVGLGFSFAAPLASAQAPLPQSPEVLQKLKVLDHFVGQWQVTVKTYQPAVTVVTYTEISEWVLDQKYLRMDSGRKSDGTQDVAMLTYDAPFDGYPLWNFSSTGAWIYLAPGSWDETNRTMTWKNPPDSTLTYVTRCIFADERTRHCKSLVRDWKGATVLNQEALAVRRP